MYGPRLSFNLRAMPSRADRSMSFNSPAGDLHDSSALAIAVGASCGEIQERNPRRQILRPMQPSKLLLWQSPFRLSGLRQCGLRHSLPVQVNRTALVSLHSLIEATGDPVQPLDDVWKFGREVASFPAIGVEVVEFRFLAHSVMALK